MSINRRFVVAIIAASTAGLFLLAGHLMPEKDSADSAAADLIGMNDRISRLEGSVTKLVAVISDFQNTKTLQNTKMDSGADDVASRNDRLRLIESELLALWDIVGQNSFSDLPDTGDELELEDHGVNPITDVADTARPSGLSERFRQDGRKSEWSRSTEAAIDDALDIVDTTTYRNISEGGVTTDCRSSICKLEWAMPDTSTLSAAELDKLLSTARMELVGLAGQGANLYGRIESRWSVAGKRPMLEVFIERRN